MLARAMAACIARLLLTHNVQPSAQQLRPPLRPLPKRLIPIRPIFSSPPPRSKTPPVRDRVQLTQLENRLFTTLKAVLLYFKLKTQLRVAGGWVRDKLLGEECSDIDIAIDDMLGKHFCRKVYWYLRTMGLETQGFGVIPSNPMQAKHLEVARMQMFGVLIDFVNLRPDNYTASSFIPLTQDFGTATEDAYRRDLTINSLFYNINTGMVEDPTGRGLSDLKAGIIATPLHAKSTFMDDPLRVLRALRFVARLDYKLHPDVKIAAADEDVKLALASKISRERIGQEINRIFMGNQPVKAIQQLVQLQLFPIIFSPPSELEMTMTLGIERLCLVALEAVWEALNYFGIFKLTVDHRRICLLAAFLSPFRTFHYENHKNKMVPVSSAIIKESLKLRSTDASKVATLHRTAEYFPLICNISLEMDESFLKIGEELDDQQDLEMWPMASAKYRAGLFLREMRGLWRAALVLSSVLEGPTIIFDMSYEDRKLELIKRSNQCIAIEEAIMKLGLEKMLDCNQVPKGEIMAESEFEQR